MKQKAGVVVFPGSNGDRDLFEAFEAANFDTCFISHNSTIPKDVKVVGLPGGFSYGDYWRAGVLAKHSKAVQCLRDLDVLIIGICNGFQILVEAGYLPGVLTYNNPPGFRHRWITVSKLPASSPWFNFEDSQLRIPMAHGEGNYFNPHINSMKNQVTLVYNKNPNGSMGDTAAVIDKTGKILGVMPHPERAIHKSIGSDDGLKLFNSARAYFK